MMLPGSTVLHYIGARIIYRSRLTMRSTRRRLRSSLWRVDTLLPQRYHGLKQPMFWSVTILSAMIYLLLKGYTLGLVLLGFIIDTLLLSHLYHPNLLDIDKKSEKIPTKLYGRHSLEAYGYRLDEYKGDFAKETDWKEWSMEMEKYCKQDVTVTRKLWEHFHPYLIGSN